MADQQFALPQAAQDTAISNALSLLTANVWAVLALMLVGIFAGMAVVAVVRMFLPDIEAEGTKAWDARSRFLTKLGASVSGVMTAWVESAYLLGIVDASLWLGVPASLIAGVVAAALNKPLFKPVKAIYRWLLGKLRKRIEADGGSASDLDDTSYRK